MSKRKPQFDFWTIVTIGILAVFALFSGSTRSSPCCGGFLEEGTGAFSPLASFTKFFGKKFYCRSLLNSLKLTVCITICSLLIGVPLASIMSFFKIRGKSIIEIPHHHLHDEPQLHRRLFVDSAAWPQRRGHSVPFQHLRHQNAVHLRLWRGGSAYFASAMASLMVVITAVLFLLQKWYVNKKKLHHERHAPHSAHARKGRQERRHACVYLPPW